MINLEKVDNSLKFTFSGNSLYLQDGTIEVPLNTLTLVTDSSDLATFKKSATNDIFVCASYDELGMTKSELETWFKNNACSTGGGTDTGTVQTMIDESISGKADSSSVYTKSETSGATEIATALSGKADASDVYTKSQTSGATEIATALSGKQDTLSAGTNITIVDNVISAEGGGGKAIVGGRCITVTTGETADTVSSNMQFGELSNSNGNSNYTIYGYAYGLGSTANTNTASENSWENFFLGEYNEISGGTRNNQFVSNVIIGGSNKIGASLYTYSSIGNNIVIGDNNTLTNDTLRHSYAFGNGNTSVASETMALGFRNNVNCKYETSLGCYNNSVSASTTFGDSGNTLFSIGNGTMSTRHNAFEIRQNGDIYCNNGTSDVKLQDYLQIKVVKITQAEYDALATKDSNTLYVING